jgi:ubiquinone/menaquinone biosynthesis C-methylase UbiE
MPVELQHEMRPNLTPDEVARQRFVSGLRGFILNDLAADLRGAYDRRVAPSHLRAKGRPPADSGEVHRALRGDPAFKTYSALRVQAQRMVWNSDAEAVVREQPLRRRAAEAVADRPGTVTLNPDLPIPPNVDAIEVHLMPGSYTGSGDGPLDPGALYDQGLAVFSMGLMGANLDDIGSSMAAYVRRRYPDFQPRAILDLGCTLGHNTLPWKAAYPEAEVHGIDVAAPGLAYASARAKMQGRAVDFHQMASDSLDFPDASFDLVFSSMFLHELSRKTIDKTLQEARRVLRPGGLMLHMELPPNTQMGAFEGFYLDWDCYYNSEPYYKAYRDQEPRELCMRAGFDPADYIQFVTPSLGLYGEAAIGELVAAEGTKAVNSETTGRLADGVCWFGFGAWRR